ncbi:GCR3 [[Candida] subhashii]|uniref:Nuclear cap-binding protein complex subunit 1 n=1 Tax=[Candida] subhashii TaxID=561895 RepID=A0A8J5QQL5_9ASCO|nr:GCR3 [[Candida] subhashii]KAG7663607.1 GCR3 [[Candida] subhashii]
METINPSKRTREEFEQEDQFQAPPPVAGYDENFEAKRQHIDPTQELITNVCKDIRRLGENPNISNQVDDVSYISNPIVAEFEKIDELRSSILSTIYALIVEQPHKINAVANLVMICNAKNFVVGKYVVEFLHAKVQGLLDSVNEDADVVIGEKKLVQVEDAGAFNNIKSILKFFSALSPMIENYAIVNIFKQFLQLAIDLQNEQPDVRNGIAQEIFYNVLISVPYLLSNDKSEEVIAKLDELVELAKTFKIVEPQSTALLQPFDSRMGNIELPYVPKTLIDLILPSLLTLQESKWDITLFIDYKQYLDPIIEEALKNNPISNELVKHPLPQFSFPSQETLSKYSPSKTSIDNLWKENSRILFQVYNHNTEFETVPKIDTYIGLFFKDISFDILTNLSFNKNEAAIQLSILDLFYSKELFAPPGSSIDQLTQIDQDNKSGENIPPLSTWKIEDVAVESILTMIFQLPHTLHPEIYYYTVLIACCRESPESIAPVFGRAIRFFYNNLETLDYELKIRYLDWMTTQISNFEFSWKWDEWVKHSQELSELKYHPRKNFIKNLIAKEIRLSNKNRIKESFITMGEEEEMIQLDEFNQYLDISIVPTNSKQFILEYDSELYGSKQEIKETLQKLYDEKATMLASKQNLTAQDEIIYNFANPELPFHEISSKVYDFIVAHWKSNTEFQELYNEILSTLKQSNGEEAEEEEKSSINAEQFLINLVCQTYAYIGSRSIYSVVSIISRDINKLKFLSGKTIKYANDEPKFDEIELNEEQKSQRQSWIINSIFRIWIHQPQVVFLILEYLIEFEIIDAKYLLTKVMEDNLIIDNVSCMESINRVLQNTSKDSLKELITLLFGSIIEKLNELSQENQDSPVKIDELTEDNSKEVDNQWLFYEYKGLLKSYFRKFIKNENVDYLEELKEIFNKVNNIPTRDDILTWFN